VAPNLSYIREILVYNTDRRPTVSGITDCSALSVGRDSSVGIVTRYGLDGSGDRSPVEARFSAPFQTDPGAHPASYKMGTGLFPRVKWSGAWR